MRHPWSKPSAAAVLATVCAACCAATAAASEVGCRSRFGPHIEGAAVDAAGNLFAVNWDRRYDSVGKFEIATKTCAAAAVASSGGTTVIGLRVLPGGAILAAAPSARAVLVLQGGGVGSGSGGGGSGSGKGAPARVFCSDARMVAPNDLAISPKTGYVYVSGQSWKPEGAIGDGDVWLCRRAGAPAVRLAQMGRTNGIEVSGDGAYLFVSESFNKGGTPASNVIWRYPIAADGTLDAAKRALVADFAQVDGTQRFDVDGMRLDTAGRLHVTRNGAGYITVLDPLSTNRVTGKIPLPFSSPTNLEFGGPDGKTLFVVGRCGVGTPWGQGDGCIEAMRVAAPGLYWSNLQRGLPRVQL